MFHLPIICNHACNLVCSPQRLAFYKDVSFSLPSFGPFNTAHRILFLQRRLIWHGSYMHTHVSVHIQTKSCKRSPHLHMSGFAEIIPLLLSTMKLPEMEADEQLLLQNNTAHSSAKGFYENLGVSTHTLFLLLNIAIRPPAYYAPNCCRRILKLI